MNSLASQSIVTMINIDERRVNITVSMMAVPKPLEMKRQNCVRTKVAGTRRGTTAAAAASAAAAAGGTSEDEEGRDDDKEEDGEREDEDDENDSWEGSPFDASVAALALSLCCLFHFSFSSLFNSFHCHPDATKRSGNNAIAHVTANANVHRQRD